MSFEKPHYDAERGAPQPTPSSSMTPSEKFLLFRDVSFVFIILLHLGTTILAIPTLTTHTAVPSSRPCLVALIVIGVLIPIFAIIGYRDRIRTSKVTSAIWFEHGWCTVFMVVDFVIAVAQSSIKGASKTAIALTWLQTVALMVYTIGLSALILLQHKKFPDVAVWKSSVQSVQWLRSSETIDTSVPPSPSAFPDSNRAKAPWEIYTDDMQEIKLGGPNPAKNAFSPEPNYVGAHPFWQEHVQRRAVLEDDMAYIIQRYGLNVEAEKRLSNKPNGTKHAKRPSIRDLEISKPIPVASTIRRANTLAGNLSGAPRRFGHQRGESLQTTHVMPPLRLDIPKSNLDVPVDAISIPETAATTKTSKINTGTRSLGLAGRTLIGASRPKASAARQHGVSSKPLPSPPAIDDSDESMRSLTLTSPQGSHSFVMAMAQRVQISASKVRPLMISTPKATETPFDEVTKPFW